MPKKCIICREEAEYKIKDTLDFYCQECAEENFSDISVLVKVEEEARKLHQKLKSALKGKSGGDDDDNGDSDEDNNDNDDNGGSESDEKNKDNEESRDNEESEDDRESKDDEDVSSS